MASTRFEHKLYNALSLAHADALEDEQKHLSDRDKPPLSGWSREKWVRYHDEGAAAAKQAATWLFLRLMQINPD